MNSAAPSLSQQYLRSRMGKVCVAIIGSTAAEMVDRATEAMRDSPFLEFRLDYLDKPLTALPKLKQFMAENSVVTAIATCRRAANGGKFKGTIAAELDVLQKASASGFHLVDLELQTAESIKATELEKLRARGTEFLRRHGTEVLDTIAESLRPHAIVLGVVFQFTKAKSFH